MGSLFGADTQLRKNVMQPDVPPLVCQVASYSCSARKRTCCSPSLSGSTVTSHKPLLNMLFSLEQALTLSLSMPTCN